MLGKKCENKNKSKWKVGGQLSEICKIVFFKDETVFLICTIHFLFILHKNRF